MTIPLKIVARPFEVTEAIESEVRSRLDQLAKVYTRIESCHVSLEAPVHHHRKGGPFSVKIDLAVPGRDVVVTHPADDDLYVAIRAGFDAARRRLEEHVDRRRHDVKAHEAR